VLGLRMVQTATYAISAVLLVSEHPLVGVAIGILIGRGVAALLATWSVRRHVAAPMLGWLVLVPAVAAAVTLAVAHLAETDPVPAAAFVALALLAWVGANRRTGLVLLRALSPVSVRR
jgi:hypothetical protein